MAASTPRVLAVAGLDKSFGARRALAGVGFSVARGEILGLIGPNGAGKTTLFDCLSGLLAADAGEVLDGGGRRLPRDRRRGVLFYVPDAVEPWRDQRVGPVLASFRDLLGEGARPAPTVAAVLASLQLEPLAAALVGTLSKGERKRFLLALGLLTPHELLLLDEPFDGLDLRQTREAMALLRAEQGRGRTLFLSIHQLADAARVCDRFVLLSGGRVAGEGTLDALRAAAGVPTGSLEDLFLALT